MRCTCCDEILPEEIEYNDTNLIFGFPYCGYCVIDIDVDYDDEWKTSDDEDEF